MIKFGWGTALVTTDLDRKAAVLADAGAGFYFGGTLFSAGVSTGTAGTARTTPSAA